jgi:23S rRNA (guanosine2251-2'-O)-methyltransferase
MPVSEQLVYGIHAVSALLASKHRAIKQLFISKDRQDSRIKELLSAAENKNLYVEMLACAKMDNKFSDIKHQGVVALAEKLPEYSERDLEHLLEKAKKPSLVLILDGVTDPHNLGACLRSANAAGVDFVIIPKDKSASITPVVSKVACGAAEAIPLVRVINLVRAIEKLKQHGIWVYGAAEDAKASLYALDGKDSVALVMGAEGQGMRRLTKEHCDALFSLPMHGTVSSLNVSVATGISLYEIVRQRHG